MTNDKVTQISNHPLIAIGILAGIYTIGNYIFNGVIPQLILGIILFYGSYRIGKLSTRRTQEEYQP